MNCPRPGQPKPYGRIHDKLQLSESLIDDVPSLRRNLGCDDPIGNWQDVAGDIDVYQLKSCIPQDDRIAFYTPSKNECGQQYDALTYRELHTEFEQCPRFPAGSNVAIVIPVEQMAEMAMALLSTIAAGAVAVPLDPRMSATRILEAMQQLQCNSLIAPESILLEKNLFEKTSDELYVVHPSLLESADVEAGPSSFFLNGVHDVRIILGGRCGRLSWTVLNKTSIGEASWKPSVITHQDSDRNDMSPGSPAMLLRTSGTTSTPKVVPISHSMLVYGAISIAAALQLQRQDCNANTMPFYHIGGISCNLLAVLVSGGSVLFAGPLTDPNSFLDHLIDQPKEDGDLVPVPTWYYAGPSMHKAIVLMAEAKWNSSKDSLSNSLRFIRSASAHLNHDLALRMSTIFQCQVIPTYGMSEAMPICSSAPIDVRNDPPCEVIDSVGYPAGTSVCIVDPETDTVLKHGSDQVGEICVKGPGVITHYIGLDESKTHFDGWLRTGDRGMLDKAGRLFIKGRSKEMIKRGGEQVWPNEIDDVVEKVPGVTTAVAFGVPNELWGEEVAVAVVVQDEAAIHDQMYLDSLQRLIMNTCEEKLDALSMPQQIKFLASTSELLRGSTGKYIRSKMAGYLGMHAVDTGALRVLTSASQIHASTSVVPSLESNDVEATQGVEGCSWQAWLQSKSSCDGSRVIPSDALNGVRFLTACFVVQVHVGLFPNLTWVKLQGYQPNMMIFFGIGSIQLASSIGRPVKNQWASFVGTKIGSLHALFVISQIIALPSFILFNCQDDEGNMAWTATDWVREIGLWLFATLTGLGHGFDVNGFTWFQSTFYCFIILFPFLDNYFRKQTLQRQGILLSIFIVLAASMWGILYMILPSEIFWEKLYPIGWSIITWLPMLMSGMLAAYIFRHIVEYYQQKKKAAELEKADNEVELSTEYSKSQDDPHVPIIDTIKDYSRVWGHVCDFCSFLLFVAWMIVALAPNCLCVYNDTFQEMRPGEELPAEECHMANGRTDYSWTCDITYNEFADYIQSDPHHVEYGRFPSMFSGAFGYMRTSAPLFLLWIFSMSFGQGFTTRLFQLNIFTRLAPLGYPVYLLQMSVARYYWLATRGMEPQYWWTLAGEHPFPVAWYEFFAILALTILLGGLVNTYLVPHLMPTTISTGVKVCLWLSKTMQRLQKIICCNKFGGNCTSSKGRSQSETDDESDYITGGNMSSSSSSSNVYDQVKTMVRGLTGVEVTATSELRYLGLDSLGAAALLGMLRCSVPAAQSLTLQKLQQCDTVGNLVDVLEGDNVKVSTSDQGKSELSFSEP